MMWVLEDNVIISESQTEVPSEEKVKCYNMAGEVITYIATEPLVVDQYLHANKLIDESGNAVLKITSKFNYDIDELSFAFHHFALNGKEELKKMKKLKVLKVIAGFVI